MFTGQAVGEGFETSGRNSAFMKTVDYTGFVSASAGSGSGMLITTNSANKYRLNCFHVSKKIIVCITCLK